MSDKCDCNAYINSLRHFAIVKTIVEHKRRWHYRRKTIIMQGVLAQFTVIYS